MIDSKLRLNISLLLVPLQTTKEVNKLAFEAILEIANSYAISNKGIDMISKSFLNELNITIKVLRAEASYLGTEKDNVNLMANKLTMIFDLILLNESLEDRKPGVPRII